MQYALILALAASAMAVPAPCNNNNNNNNYRDVDLLVRLSDDAGETGATASFNTLPATKQVVSAKYGKVELEVRKGPEGAKKNLRCKILDTKGKAITITRGSNIDTTFSDADKGAWMFPEVEVAHVVCDPSFKANPQKPAATPSAKPN